MFDRVLVANRGEIAVRVMRACEELGVDTVAVYSDADRDAGHVRYADEAYNVGPARAADSYLDGEAIVDAAERAGADAIHPGYGFLAENAEFAARVEASPATWIGPTSEAMERLGGKTSARRAMADAGVPIVPGTTDPVTDAGEVVTFGEEHGFPVAIKAEGGGGGRGMKVVRSADEAGEKLDSARREGEAYFDDDSVYLERYLGNPRHVEVQVLADEHGTVAELGERDCSLQRRHQKVIEEAPSPALSDDLRAEITDAARRGVEAAGYTNAGTVEFLVAEPGTGGVADREGRLADADFYFLEVNTRIQVEHTVTEAITGIDIVKWQLRVAAGEALDLGDTSERGHAMEFRINAENAAEEFAPATGGRLETYDPPGGIGVRVDDALRQGDDLVTDYDSMIAKLIVSGRDRAETLARARRALAEFNVEGIETIMPFHRLMLDDEAFAAGRHTTKYLDEALDPDRIAEAQRRWGAEPAGATAGTDDATDGPEREFTVEVDGKRFEVNLTEHGAPAIEPDTTDQPRRRRDETESTAAAGGTTVTAEMQGTVLGVEVTEGEEVTAGDVVLVLEAMKMENDVIAESGGTVTEVAVGEGDSVDAGEVLLVIE